MKKSDNNHLPELRKRVAKASTGPGVYRWLNAKGEVLYVGKAKNLRNRLKSYLPAGQAGVSPAKDASLGPWKESLIQKVADFDVTVTSNELEALVLESNLIKELKPKYNVLLKDDKNYVYVRISVQDAFPNIEIVRRMEDDSAKYFGPFLSASSLRKLLDVLQAIYGYRACKRSIDALNKDAKTTLSKACLEYQIGKCCGLCVEAVSHADYKRTVQHITSFFKGDHKETLQRIQKEMQDAAANKKFERAAVLRDAFQYIQSLQQQQQVVSDTTGTNADYIGVVLQTEKAQVVLLKERGGKLVGELNFALGGQADTVESVLDQFLPQYYSTATDIPSQVFLGTSIEQVSVMEAWLTERKGARVRIAIPERGKKSKLLLMAEKNAQEKVQQQLARWEAAAKNTEQALTDLQKILSLPELPKRIEGYDISHHSGTETVGSMVVLKNGKTANDQYRSFTIRTLKEGQVDDYAALKEVLKRRLLHLVRNLKEEEKAWKEEGVTFGKARKKEQEDIESIMQKNAEHFHLGSVDYKEFLVARKNEQLVGFVRLYKHPNKVLELKTLWVDEILRGHHLGHTLCHKMMKPHPKEKVYISVYPKYESYYTEMGFQYIHQVPAVISKANKAASQRGGKFTEGTVLVHLPSTRKTDTSLSSRPDLLVIDGGKGQLNTVTRVLEELKLDIPVIGLAKREEDVFVPGRKTLVPFPKDSQAKFLLMRLRDEAHRFANRHRTSRSKKAMTHSVLDDIPGIGEKTKKALLQEFGSVEQMQNVPDDQLRVLLSPQQLAALRKLA